MRHHVIVSFGKDNDLEFKVSDADVAGLTVEEAQRWFAQEFEDLECDVATPIGKVLRVDLVLSVAKYSGERRFREDRGWAEQYARNAAILLGRDLIRVDLPAYTVGY